MVWMSSNMIWLLRSLKPQLQLFVSILQKSYCRAYFLFYGGWNLFKKMTHSRDDGKINEIWHWVPSNTYHMIASKQLSNITIHQ
jgi:hypothetical protein